MPILFIGSWNWIGSIAMAIAYSFAPFASRRVTAGDYLCRICGSRLSIAERIDIASCECGNITREQDPERISARDLTQVMFIRKWKRKVS
jgi:hypothetical protein